MSRKANECLAISGVSCARLRLQWLDHPAALRPAFHALEARVSGSLGAKFLPVPTASDVPTPARPKQYRCRGSAAKKERRARGCWRSRLRMLWNASAARGPSRPASRFHSITPSARASIVAGTSMPRAFAVRRLITNSNFVGCSMGRSAGLAPRRILTSCRVMSSR